MIIINVIIFFRFVWNTLKLLTDNDGLIPEQRGEKIYIHANYLVGIITLRSCFAIKVKSLLHCLKVSDFERVPIYCIIFGFNYWTNYCYLKHVCQFNVKRRLYLFFEWRFLSECMSGLVTIFWYLKIYIIMLPKKLWEANTHVTLFPFLQLHKFLIFVDAERLYNWMQP